MSAGVVYALLAGLMWGFIFIVPVLLPEYPATLHSTGRYLAFGLIALPLLWLSRRKLHQLSRQDWLEAMKLSAVGNLLYYACLAEAIRRIGAPVTTMIIGTLPVVIAITANLLYSRYDGKLSWLSLTPSLLLIIAGLLLVNIAELQQGAITFELWRYSSGIFLAIAAVACWTWYALRNARWLRKHPDKNPVTWATVQGAATLPLALVGYLLVYLHITVTNNSFELPLGPKPELFIPLMIAVALLCSWLGTLCWNEASQRLPTVLVGPLIIFETLAGLLYTFILRQTWPPVMTLCGIICLITGVLYAMKVKPQPEQDKTA
ncbi:DMT family transporter [Chromatiaceae bacterium AAb-1]|nr:DMT family transporter [Chromatiaceae bacterium AAb-1]